MARTWILTGSPENHAATAAHEIQLIGLKERNRNRALEIEPGDRIVLYATRIMAFAASIRVEGEMFEDREKVWPGKPGKVDAYPWRFATSPEIVLDEPSGCPPSRWSASSSTSANGRASTGSSPSRARSARSARMTPSCWWRA